MSKVTERETDEEVEIVDTKPDFSHSQALSNGVQDDMKDSDDA